MNPKKGVTLIEILIAFVLVFLIGLAIVNIDLASRLGFIQSANKVDVNNEARFALEHMVRHLRLANNVSVAGVRITLRLDHNLNNNIPLNTPSDFTDDHECRYEYDAGQHKIKYEHKAPAAAWTGAWEDITNPNTAGGVGADVIACNFNFLGGPGLVPAVTIQINLVDNAALPAATWGSPDNPRVSLQTKVILRCSGNI